MLPDPDWKAEDQPGVRARTSGGNKDKDNDDNQGGDIPAWMFRRSNQKTEKSAPKERDSKKKPAQPKENYDRARRNVKVKEGATEEKCVAGPVVTRAQAKKSDKVHPLKVKEAMSSVDKSTIENLQKKDSTLKKCFDRIGKPIIRENYVGEFYKKNGLLYRKHQETKTGQSFNQLVVPKELRRQVMSVNHESAFSGHLGAKKTEVRILPNFFWPGLRQDVIRFCRSCDVCQRTVKRGSVKKVPLGSMPLIDTSFKRVAVDIVGPIAPPSEAGHRYILTLVDYATRYPEAVPLKKITTEAVAEALLDIYSRVGIPEEVLTDQGTQFMSECMQEVSRLLSIKGLTSTPYHPICNGLVERWNGTLKSMLKRLCQDQPKQWHRLINPVLFAYREVPQESTGFSPFQLLYGRSVRGPGTILKELWTKEVNIPEVKSSYEYVTELRERLEDSLKLAQEELEKSQKRYKRHYDRKATPRRLEVGDRVLILLPTDSNKLLMQWRGPYTVESRVGANDYRVKMGSKTKTYHVNMLKKYISREPEGNVVPVDDTDGVTVAVAGVIHQDVDPELGEVPDLEGYRLLGASRMEFLGHQVGGDVITPSRDNLEKVRNTPRPTTKKQVRSFLGLVGYYRDHIPAFAEISAPLTDLLKKGKAEHIQWSEAQERAYFLLKEYLLQEPVLKLPDLSKPFVLRTDASGVGVAAVLLQENDGKLYPLGYASRKLNLTEARYPIIEKECLAVVWGIKRFKLYLAGRRFTLQTDHKPLKYLKDASYQNDRVFRWAVAVQEYSFRVEDIPGRDNIGADFLSRTGYSC